MDNLTTLESKLANALTQKGHTYTKGQLTYVCNSTHELTNGKTFNNTLCITPTHIDLMVENFLDFRNLTKYESDFNQI